MFNKIIKGLILRHYIRKSREIHKMEPDKELSAFMFGREEDTVKILRNLLTAQTISYFEAKDKEEQLLVKGMALMLKLLLDAHKLALLIKTKDKDIDNQVIMWKKGKIKLLINLSDNKITDQ